MFSYSSCRYWTCWFFAAVLVTGLGCRRGQPVAEVRPMAAISGDAASLEAETAVIPHDDDFPGGGERTERGSLEAAAPTEWSPTKNVVWSVSLPGKGHASPIVWGDQVFIATADDSNQTMSLLSYSRTDGALRWSCLLHEGGFMHTHGKNTQASATPACDGQHVYWTAMVKDAIWVSAVTLDGKIAWQTEAGPFVSMHGYGSSPGALSESGDRPGRQQWSWLAGSFGQKERQGFLARAARSGGQFCNADCC